MLRRWLLILCAITLGCSVGNKQIVDDSKTSQIAEGRSTKTEVKALLGEPFQTQILPDGSEIYLYSYSQILKPSAFIPIVGIVTAGKDSKINSIHLLFDKNGVLQKMEKTEMPISRDIAELRKTREQARKGGEFTARAYSNAFYEDRRQFLEKELANVKPEPTPINQEALMILPSDEALKTRLVYLNDSLDFDITIKKFALQYDTTAEALKRKNIFKKVTVQKSDNPEKAAKDVKLKENNLVIYNRWDYSKDTPDGKLGLDAWLIKKPDENPIMLPRTSSIVSLLYNIKTSLKDASQ